MFVSFRLVEESAEPGQVRGVAVVRHFRGFVRFPEADQIGRDHAQPGAGERRHHLSIQVAPGRLAVQQQHGVGAARTFVEIVHSKAGTDVCVVGREREVLNCRKSDFRVCAGSSWPRAERITTESRRGVALQPALRGAVALRAHPDCVRATEGVIRIVGSAVMSLRAVLPTTVWMMLTQGPFGELQSASTCRSNTRCWRSDWFPPHCRTWRHLSFDAVSLLLKHAAT